MDERTTGLILRTRPLTETSLIVQWLTPDCGRLSTVAKGARRPKSPFQGRLDIFYLADFSFRRSRRSDLHILREVNLCETHVALRREIGYLQQAAYCSALVEQSTEAEAPLPAVFQLMKDLLLWMQQAPPQPKTIFTFEMKLLTELGLRPDLKGEHLSAGVKQVLEKLAELDWPSLARLQLSPVQNDEVQRFLHGFLIYHLGRIPAKRAQALHGLMALTEAG